MTRIGIKKYYKKISTFIIAICLIVTGIQISRPMIINAASSGTITEEGDSLTYTGVSGTIYSFTATVEGNYYVEAVGASGGAFKLSDSVVASPGLGGYAAGYIYLDVGDTLYMCIGTTGTTATYCSTAKTRAGGYNGGGQSVCYSYWYCSGGGGATSVAKVTGTLASIGEDDLDDIYLVAGGGGGGIIYYKSSSIYSISDSGDGGGENGDDSGSSTSAGGMGVTDTDATAGTGGTQSEGGTSYGSNATAAGFGTGAYPSSAKAGTTYAYVGGGGGLFGGGTGSNGCGAGGGSSYIGDVTDGVTVSGVNTSGANGYVTITLGAPEGPEITSVALSTSDPTSDTITATVTSEDATAYSIDGETYQSSNVFTISENGTYYFYAEDSYDRVGDAYEVIVNNIDTDDPEITSCDISPSEWTNGNVIITVAASDNVEVEAYSIDSEDWQKSNKLEVSVNGTYEIYVEDTAGNISDAYEVYISNIDKTAPAIDSITQTY